MEGSGISDLEEWARKLLREAPVARLGLLDEADHPRVLPVTFAIAGGALWSAIDRKPKRADRELARLRFLRRRPHVALTVDRYEEDWRGLAWVQVLAMATVLAIADGAEGLSALAEKYEQYREDPPPGPLLRFEPQRVLAWRASQG